MRFLEERGVGHPVGAHIVPIVPAAIIFDLGVGNGMVRPTAAEGYAAAEAATGAPVQQGSVGAGAGATVGKALGRERAMKGGVGSASLDLGDGVVLAALTVVNAVGGVHDPGTGALLAGSRGADGAPIESTGALRQPRLRQDPGAGAERPRQHHHRRRRDQSPAHEGAGKPPRRRSPTMASPLAIRPAHTPHDGDTMFALATCEVDAPEEFTRLCALTPSVVARAVVSAIEHATDLHGYPAYRSMSHG